MTYPVQRERRRRTNVQLRLAPKPLMVAQYAPGRFESDTGYRDGTVVRYAGTRGRGRHHSGR